MKKTDPMTISGHGLTEHEKIPVAALDALKKAGADRAQAILTVSAKTEINIENGRMNLLRTTEEYGLHLRALVGARKGVFSVNRIDGDSAVSAAREAVELARSSPADEANDISPFSPKKFEESGPAEPDLDGMYDRLDEFLSWEAAAFPLTPIESGHACFRKGYSFLANTNGVRFGERTGFYSFSAIFTTKDGRRTSSMNYSGCARRGLDLEFRRWGSVGDLLRQSAEQLDPGTVGGTFTGQIIVTPDCLGEFIDMLAYIYLADGCLIQGTSPYRNSLGLKVASPLFTLRSAPRSLETTSLYTPDGFEAEDSAYIENGILKGFMLSQYGANKTGLPRAPNAGGFWTVDPGTSSLDDLVRKVDRGLLLCRFSCNPSPNGDFSGVAKNSYYIEDGRIVGPVKETMVSGNAGKLLESVSAVSSGRIDYGYTVRPWILADGVTIAGD